jgi:hypothetical protein
VTSVNDSSGNSVFWTIPEIGTEEIYQAVVPDSVVTVYNTLIILATKEHIGEKTNVISYSEGPSAQDSGFYNIEPNGDISIGDSMLNSSGEYSFRWTTFPTGSRQPISDPVIDTTEHGADVFQSDVRTFVDTETITTLAGVFSTLHVREITINIISEPDSDITYENYSDITDTWFAPSIGWKVREIDNVTINGKPQSQSETDLIKFEPK